jgi:secreted trypsin-like serine protease
VAAVVLAELALAVPASAEAPPGEIVGGEPADPGEYPFQVGLLFHDEPNRFQAQFCGGALISPDTVLTAGHCVDFLSSRGLDILAGTVTLGPGGGQRVRARRIRIHPAYDPLTLNHDLAIVQLGTHLPYEPIDIVTPGEGALWSPGTMATVTGWGNRTPQPGPTDFPTRLHEVDVPIVSDAQCQGAYPETLIPNSHVCAGDTVDGGEDSCFGDSGGPMFVPDGDRFVEVGIVSTGRGCARRNFPGIYTQIDTHFGFIEPYLDPDEPPDRVRRPRTRPVTEHSVRLAWDPPVFDGGTRITHYLVEVDGNSAQVVPGQRHFRRLRGLAHGAHDVTITPVNAVGPGTPRTLPFTV